MIKDKIVEVKINSKNYSHFRKLGYDVHCNDIINVPPEELTKGSHILVNVVCDICGKENNIIYKNYFLSISKYGFYTCKKCSLDKVKKTNQSKLGVDYLFESEDYKEDYKNKMISKYGVDNPAKSKDIKDKIKNTNKDKYDVEWGLKSDIIKEKSKKTLLDKYNVDHISKVKNKKKDKVLKYNKDIVYDFSIESNNYRIELEDFIKDNYNGIIDIDNRNIINKELDIYLPELNLAFEFNGLYWHNELNKSKKYHLEKTELCESKGIKLIHIYEDDWIYKKNIIKSRILNLLNKNEVIYARKCIIKGVSSKDTRNFLNENHLQGYYVSSINIGLYYKDELYSLMSFGKKRKCLNSSSDEGQYEMVRFCSKNYYSVVGGASRLFKYFLEKYKPTEVVSYADRSWSDGSLYYKLGFNFIHKTGVNYYYIVDGIRKHRFGFRKDILIKEGFDSSKTEHQIMLDRGIYRIYDSGTMKFIYK